MLFQDTVTNLQWVLQTCNPSGRCHKLQDAHSTAGRPLTDMCSSPTILQPCMGPSCVNSSASDTLQVLIYQALGFQEPAFGHVSLILAPDKSKLSKRHGATSVGEFRAQGYLPEAMINYLSLLGWNDGTEQVSTAKWFHKGLPRHCQRGCKNRASRTQGYLPEAAVNDLSILGQTCRVHSIKLKSIQHKELLLVA